MGVHAKSRAGSQWRLRVPVLLATLALFLLDVLLRRVSLDALARYFRRRTPGKV